MHDPSISIALNVSRARLTVIGIVLTINIFALGIFLSDMERQVSLNIMTELSVFYALVASICVGTVAAILMLISERFDPLGNSDVGIFAIAEMTMFVAIVQTISGISKGFIVLFHVNLGASAVATLGVTSGGSELVTAGETFRVMVFWLISITWVFIAYVAPAWSLCRLPARRQHKLAYAAYYLVLSSLVLLLSALALDIELLARGEPSSVARLFFQNFWAPGLWGEIIGTR